MGQSSKVLKTMLGQRRLSTASPPTPSRTPLWRITKTGSTSCHV